MHRVYWIAKQKRGGDGRWFGMETENAQFPAHLAPLVDYYGPYPNIQERGKALREANRFQPLEEADAR